MLRSKKGDNEISPKTEEQVKPKRKRFSLSPKTIGTENPWESKRKAQRILKAQKREKHPKRDHGKV